METVIKDSGTAGVSLNFDTATTTSNYIIDVLYALPSHGWDLLKENYAG